MSDTESFEDARVSAQAMIYDCDIPLLDRLKAAHDREIRDTAQQEYDRGFHAGEHSMDAEHRAIAMRLRALPLDGGSHENLSQIARAIYHSDWGWTQGACASLRDELVRLMGGVSDDTCDSQCGGACAAGDGRDSGEQEVTDERVADDSGAAVRCGDGGGDLHMAGVTDELREFVDNNWPKILHETKTTKAYVLLRIADRIDERAKHDRDSDQLRIEKLVEQRDAARARTDELSDELLRTRRERDELRAKLAIIRETIDG